MSKYDAATRQAPHAARPEPFASTPTTWQERVTYVLAGVMVLLLLLPLVALVARTVSVWMGFEALSLGSVVDALVISLATTSLSAGLIVLLGTPLAWVLARHNFPLKRPLSILVEIPIIMPPVVAGLALLTAFGRRGLLGGPLAALDITLAFTPAAVVLAQVFVASPFYIRAAQTRFGGLPRELEEAAGIDGADYWSAFWHIVLPLSARALLTGLLLSWARALGEFGATILFAGNLPGRTQTMPLLVYAALESDLNATFVTAVILLAMAAFALGLTRWIARLDMTGSDPLSVP